jgi:hypothetical protein
MLEEKESARKKGKEGYLYKFEDPEHSMLNKLSDEGLSLIQEFP